MNMLPKEVVDEEGNNGFRSDRINLIEAWKKLRESRNQTYEYVWNKEQLNNVKNSTDYLLGMFNVNKNKQSRNNMKFSFNFHRSFPTGTYAI